MAGGLAALLDDVAVIAKMTSAAGTKAAGVVVDDTAVTPRYMGGISPARELPMIGKIVLGSLRNKLLIILPIALLLSQFVPWLLTPLLMVGGTYLSFEGAEKLLELVRGHEEDSGDSTQEKSPDQEKKLVRGAIMTDFILSSEIMVVALNQVASAPLVPRAVTLIVVGIALTVLVYGVVALIVKMDDVGLKLTEQDSAGTQKVGRLLVRGMPVLLSVLSKVGIVAMLWVGGHILLVGADAVGWHAPEALVHHLEDPLAKVAGIGEVLGWLVNTLCSAIIGMVVGAIVVAIVHVLPFGKGDKHQGQEHQGQEGKDDSQSAGRTADR